MTFPRVVTATLLEEDATTVVTNALVNAFDIWFLDEINGVGSGGLSLPLSDPNWDEVTSGRFVRVQVEGVARFVWRIEGNPSYREIDEGEEAQQVLDIQGRGWACVFDDACVVPEFRLDSVLDSSWRLWSFASPGFPNDSGWAPAREQYEYLDGVAHGWRWQEVFQDSAWYLHPAPVAFPWPLSPLNSPYQETYWTWPDMAGDEDEGYAFFRKDINLANGIIATIDVSSDNLFTLYLDGVPILGEKDDEYMWTGYKSVSFGVTDGPHTLAAVVHNVPWPPGHENEGVPNTNPGGFIFTMYEVASGDVPETLYVVSDDTWDTWFSATDWPGWTTGQILDSFISESQARQALVLLQRGGETWDDDDGSDGDPWTSIDVDDPVHYIPGFAMRVGSTGLDLLNSLNQDGYLDWHVRPNVLTLDAYNQGEIGTNSGVSLVHGTNIASLQRGETVPYANRLYVQYGEGFFTVVENAAAIAALGYAIEDVYATNAAEENDAQRLGRIELQRRVVDSRAAIIVGVEPVSTADCPYEGFAIGDYVTVPALGGGTTSEQVLSISCRQDPEGFAQWELNVGRRWRVRVREEVELLRTIGGKTQAEPGSAW